ncbi:MAG: EamA family transporter [Bacteroidota bacterium]
MNNNKNFISWSILLSLMLVWGSSFILIKKSLDFFSATEVGILRVTVTFIFLLPVALIKIRKIDKKHRNYLIISGLIGSLIPSFLFAIAQTQINSFLAGTLNSLTPLFTLFIGLAFFKFKTGWYNVLGVFIGLFGAIGLIYASSGDLGFADNIKYASLIIIAAICYAFNVNFIKLYLKQIDSLAITALTFFYIGIPSLIYVLFLTDIPNKLLNEENSLIGLGYISILSVFGTAIALIAFNKLIKMSSPIFASSVTYIIPIVAIAWGIIDGEIFELIYLAWFALILVGVLLVNTSNKNNFFKFLFKSLNKR